MNELELYRLRALLNMVTDIEENCKKAKTMQMQLIISRDALLLIKIRLLRYINELEPKRGN